MTYALLKAVIAALGLAGATAAASGVVGGLFNAPPGLRRPPRPGRVVGGVGRRFWGCSRALPGHPGPCGAEPKEKAPVLFAVFLL